MKNNILFNKKKINIIFRFDVSNKTGYGHFHRCLSLSEYFNNYNLFFVTQNNVKKFHKQLLLKNIKTIYLNNNTDLLNEFKLLEKKIDLKNSIYFFDLCNRERLLEKIKFKNYVEKINNLSNQTIIIDGIDKHSFVRTKNYNVSKVLIPYLNNNPINHYQNNFKLYSGIEYFIFNKKIKKYRKNSINKKVKKVLITFGGSDPKHLTTYFLKLVLKKNINKIYVIIGPYFEINLINKINNISKKYRNVKMIYSPGNIYKYIKESDICISHTGHTKYELFKINLPSILISIDQNHHLAHRFFKRLNCSMYLGCFKKSKFNYYSNSVDKIIFNYQLRKTYNINCSKLFNKIIYFNFKNLIK